MFGRLLGATLFLSGPAGADGTPEEATWAYGGEALAYRPDGDPDGPADGFPGSLFGTGLDQVNLVSEISIPAPVVSAAKDPEALPVAATLQPFADVRGNLFTPFVELPRVGLCVLADVQTGEKLHLCWGQHFQEDAEVRIPSHGRCDPTLASPATRGAWWIGDASLYAVNGYLMEIPDAWATAHVGGRRLGTGRFRDGGWSGMGPSLYAARRGCRATRRLPGRASTWCGSCSTTPPSTARRRRVPASSGVARTPTNGRAAPGSPRPPAVGR